MWRKNIQTPCSSFLGILTEQTSPMNYQKHMFEAAASDLSELTDIVTSYISFCEDVCVQNKTFCTYSNNNPRFTPKLRRLRQSKEEAYRSGDCTLFKQARNSLTKEIRVAKRSYTEKLKNNFSSNNPATSSPRSSIDLWSCVKCPPASNAPPSCRSPRNPPSQD